MSVTAANFTGPTSARPGTAVLRTARAATNWALRKYAVRRNRRALNALADRVLADIGFDRSDIDRIVRDRLDDAGRPTGGQPF